MQSMGWHLCVLFTPIGLIDLAFNGEVEITKDIPWNAQSNLSLLTQRELIKGAALLTTASAESVLKQRAPLNGAERLRCPMMAQNDARPLAFWNLSNHPSVKWTEAQRAAALALAPGAEVVDVPFPDVDPYLDTSALKAEAAAVVEGWGAPSAGERRVVAAMVAGEPLMCMELVGALEARGVRCYSATTRRVVEEVNGEKRSRFEFVRFRAWR